MRLRSLHAEKAQAHHQVRSGLIMNTTHILLDKACPTQDPAVVSGSCCMCGCKHGILKDYPPNGSILAAECPQPNQCMSDPHSDRCSRSYLYTSNGNRYRRVRGINIAYGDSCSGTYCSCEIPSSCPRPKYCESVLASVAEAQLNISSMLKAEADKLDKAIEVAGNNEQLLAINEAVHRTLIAVIFLEQALYFKLEQMKDMCGSCKMGSLATNTASISIPDSSPGQ